MTARFNQYPIIWNFISFVKIWYNICIINKIKLLVCYSNRKKVLNEFLYISTFQDIPLIISNHYATEKSKVRKLGAIIETVFNYKNTKL